MIPEVVKFRVQSTFTNTQVFTSSLVTLTISCNNNYEIYPLSTLVSTQYYSHTSLQEGFVIPKYASSQQWGCPVNSYLTSSSNVLLFKPNDLNDPVEVSQNRVVYASDRSAHKLYQFYARVQAEGGSNIYSGPFDLFMGCVGGGVTFTDSPSFITNHAMSVGASTSAVYTFHMPGASLTWCEVQTVSIVDNGGNAWTENVKIVASENCASSTNCTWFDLVSSDSPDYIEFKVLTTYLNSLSHLSPTASISIADVFTYTESYVDSTLL